MNGMVKCNALLFQNQRTTGKLDFDFNNFYELSVFVFPAQVNISPNRIGRYSAQLVQLLRNHSRQTVAVFDVYGMDNSMHVFWVLRALPFPASRVRPLYKGLQLLYGRVGVHLGGGEIRVPQKTANRRQVCSHVQQMRCEGVPQHVRTGLFDTTCLLKVRMNHGINTLGGHCFFSRFPKKYRVC
jgi:hypothetical protein